MIVIEWGPGGMAWDLPGALVFFGFGAVVVVGFIVIKWFGWNNK